MSAKPRRSKKELTVLELPEADYERWSQLVRDSPNGSAYSLPAYLDALCSTAGGSFKILVAQRGEQLVGGIGLYERSSPAGSFVAPRLLLYYNGFVLLDYATKYPSDRTSRQLEVTAALAEALEARGYGRLELRSRSTFTDVRPLQERGWSVAPSYTYCVPVTDLEAQWGRAEQNFRRLVERGREHGLTVAVEDDFASFYRLHALTAERKGAPLYLPEAAFRRYFELLRERDLCRLYHCRLPEGGPVVATQLVLTGHPVAHTVSAAADPEHQQLGANGFLRWSALEDLAALGHTANDLTDATLGPVARFKGQLGGALEPCFVAQRPLKLAFRLQVAARDGVRRLRR